MLPLDTLQFILGAVALILPYGFANSKDRVRTQTRETSLDYSTLSYNSMLTCYYQQL